jgi:hypothetical protein
MGRRFAATAKWKTEKVKSAMARQVASVEPEATVMPRAPGLGMCPVLCIYCLWVYDPGLVEG